VEISIDNVIPQALVDTGAAVIAISEYFFSRLSKSITRNKIESEDEKLHSICGQSMTIAGIYGLPISLDVNKNEIYQQFYVIPNITETCVIGMHFITRNAVTYKCKARKLTYTINNKTFTIDDEEKILRHYKVKLARVKVAVKELTATFNV
jgi:hypothetical protein